MIQRQDYIVPYFNGTYRFDKPVCIQKGDACQEERDG